MVHAMLTQCLALLLPASQQQQQLFATRRNLLLHGAVASLAMPAAVRAADASLGSSGISAYEKLKLDTANSELAEAIIASASSQLKPSLDAYAAALVSIANSETKDVAPKLDAASLRLSESAASESKFADQVAAIEKQSRSTAAACDGKDIGAAALAATKLADGLTDLAYGWTAAVRPLQEITIGQPDLKPAGGYKEGVSGLGTRKGGML